MKLAVLAACAASLALTACMGDVIAQARKDPNCTVKGMVRGSYGSVTPTGTYSGSFLCKTGDKGPDPAKVAEPAAPPS